MTDQINIGITIGLTSFEEKMWVNGIKMNAIFLMRALQMINENYNVYLINTNDKFRVEDPEMKLPWDREKYPIYDYSKIAVQTDLLIMLGTTFGPDSVKSFKSLPDNKLEKKVIAYRCGNNYVIDVERSIFKEGKDAPLPALSGKIDDVWFVPQQQRHNKYLYDVLSKVNSKPVPFLWSPEFLDQYVYDISKEKPKDVDGAANNVYLPREKKRLVCFEPNINVLKSAYLPTVAVEEAYNKDSSKIENYTICSGNKIGVNQTFVGTVRGFNITKDKILKVDGRYPMPHYLMLNTDIVVSHQWDNPLNYAYLDALYMGYPLVHNAPMVQDGGYYYDDFNVIEASEKILEAINKHDLRLNGYNRRSKNVYQRYMPEHNTSIVSTYDALIKGLWDSTNIRESYEYDWQTNTYK